MPTAPPLAPPLAPAHRPPTTLPPPPGLAPAPASPPPPTGRMWPVMVAILALVVAAALAGGGLAAVLDARERAAPERDPAVAVFAAARAFVARQHSVRFDFTGSFSLDAIDAADVVVMAGAYESTFPDWSRTIHDDGTETVEEIDVPGIRYVRRAPHDVVLGEVAFEVHDVADGPVVAQQALDFYGFLDRAHSPRVLGEADGIVTLAVAVERGSNFFFDDAKLALADKELTLEVGPTGEVRTVSSHGHAGAMEFTVTTDMINWSVDVEPWVPEESEIDRTPTIDEPLLEEFDEVEVLTPASVPEHWELATATVLPPEATAEGCRQGYVAYVDPRSGDHLDLFSLPPGCETVVPPDAAAIVVPGGAGWIATLGGETWAELIVGGTRFQVRSSLSIDEVLQVLRRIEVFDPADPPPPDLVLGITS